jgi:hypothetical protein
VVAHLLLKHHRDDCKFVRYWNRKRSPRFQQSSLPWINSGGDRGEQAVLRSFHIATTKAGLGGSPWSIEWRDQAQYMSVRASVPASEQLPRHTGWTAFGVGHGHEPFRDSHHSTEVAPRVSGSDCQQVPVSALMAQKARTRRTRIQRALTLAKAALFPDGPHTSTASPRGPRVCAQEALSDLLACDAFLEVLLRALVPLTNETGTPTDT